MKALKTILSLLLGTIIISPCLLLFNEQPMDEPQRWWINLIGVAYSVGLYVVGKRFFKQS